MKPKMTLKMGIDLVMTVLLLCQMAYMLVGETAHEYLGTAMFVLFILHHLLNRNWYRSLKKGRYGAVRILQTAVNTLVLLCMLGLMVSGVILSREVFAFLPIQGGMGFGAHPAHAGLLLGLCDDERPPGAALGHGDGDGAQALPKKGKLGCAHRRFAPAGGSGLRLWHLRLCQKQHRRLPVPAQPVCFL